MDAESAKAIEVAACDGPVTFHRILNPILMEEDSDPNPEDHPVDVVSPDPSIEGNPSRVEGADPKNIFPISGRLHSALKSEKSAIWPGCILFLNIASIKG